MRLTRDEHAASPLVVIATFVLGAVLITAGAYVLFFDRPDERLQVVTVQDASGLAFEVTAVAGGLDWSDVTLRLLDRAGTDQAPAFLQAPNGSVQRGDRIAVEPQLAAGSYLLLVLHGADELSRLRIDI